MRIKGGSGSHREQIKQARHLLGDEHAPVLVQVEVARTIRNDVQYQVREVSEIELAAVLQAAGILIEAVRARLSELCPQPCP